MNRIIPVVVLVFIGLIFHGCPAETKEVNPLLSDTWEAIDMLGRSVSVHDQTGSHRENRTIGLFYFLWMGSHVNGGPYDVSNILADHPEAVQDAEHPAWGPMHAMHHWGEPLFGYYNSDDPWVLQRHARMLADALVDVIIFDVTNRFTYRDYYMPLCKAFSEVRRQGTPAPQIAFLCPFWDPKSTAAELYRDLYEPGLYRDLWFQWEGKPLIMADPDQVDDELKNFFTFRKPMPSYFTGPDGPDQWGWLEVYPQHIFKNSRGEAEQMTVGVAQNAVEGRLGALSEEGAQGRSFHDGQWDTRPDAVRYGFNFMEQWSRALEVDPKFLFITGWNEWIAMRFDEFNSIRRPVMFVDQFDHEDSRDIEPMRGGHGDTYYYQMVDYIRKYKGTRPQPAAGICTSIDIAGGFEPWEAVTPTYHNHRGSTLHRNHAGYAGTKNYTDETGRNDIVSCKVTHDNENLYFYVETAEAMTPYTNTAWMRLFLNTDRKTETGWEGFDYVVNRSSPQTDFATLEHSSAGWNWKEPAKIIWYGEGNKMHLSIPRSALGIEENEKPDIRFKWADNMQHDGDMMDFTLYGDAAPPGRFTYRYYEK
ncbi:MAG: hypothetical protein KAH38_02960 [Candidatus Hydrogenedentes bacterium]|nr:hypothetical protein [Candidatus Hydrogenedentota bacterium]